GLEEALRLSPVPLATMGRGLDQERPYFLAAAAAGRYAALRVPLDEPTTEEGTAEEGTAGGKDGSA
ncbi:MAG: uncharacterized protein JWO98_5292, partial [Frankiales bacterium]|nr:uncharacterized protein [Frankiales bacterium]